MSLPRLTIIAAALLLGATGCASTSSTVTGSGTDSGPSPVLEDRELIVNVAGQRSPCTGVAPKLCLQVRTQPGAPWQLHYGDIEGFDWQSGTEYVIRVREEAVANPPADAPSRRWVLLEVLDSGPAL